MSWFSKIFSGIDQVAADVNPMKGVMDSLANDASKIPLVGGVLGAAGKFGADKPAEAYTAASLAEGGGALLGGAGAGADAGLDAADSGSVNLFADAVPGAGGDVGASALSDAAAGTGGDLGSLGLDSSATNLFSDAVPGAGGDVGSSALGGIGPGGAADLSLGGGGDVGYGIGQQAVDSYAPSTASGFGGVGTDPSVMPSPDGGLALQQQTAGAAANSSTGALQDALKTALKYGPAGLSLLRSVMGQSAYSKAASQLSNVGSTQRATANGLVQGYNNGTLNPAESAGIDTWAQQQVAALRQFYANAGTADSTQAKQAEAAVMAQAVQMKNQATQNLLQVGLNELNTLDANTVAGIKVNLQGDQAATQAQANFAATFAKLIGAQQSGNAPAPAPAGG